MPKSCAGFCKFTVQEILLNLETQVVCKLCEALVATNVVESPPKHASNAVIQCYGRATEGAKRFALGLRGDVSQQGPPKPRTMPLVTERRAN